MQPRILVVGAGPTGLAAALELARRGIGAEIVERRPAPSQLSRAVGILPGTMDILRPSGAAEAIAAEAVAYSGVTFHHGARPLAALDFAPLPNSPSPVLGLAQDRTETHLADALARYGGHVRYGTPLAGLRQDDTGVTAELPNGPERFDIVIGADGVGSAVRQALGLGYDGYEVPDTWSIADVISPDWPEPTRFKAFLLPKGKVCIVAPLAPNRFRVIASQPDALAALPVPMQVAELRRSAAFSISVRQAATFSQGRVHLAGDAAHCHSPVGGRGMNLGIADAADLARRIAEGDIAGYTAGRHAKAAETIRLTERGRRLVQARTGLGRLPLYAALMVISWFPTLQRRAVAQLSET